ncbi:CpsD/CapB family tyrosine-protein kinase [Planomicrobium sp. CPCC 101079]|uniref:CpsD/CapB family tyrosine-protein kinase n=1 Tax=Planomicrobium sp. CPCC 101079 TaxID=2599618 RepID=UPI0011B4937A|nr:CpsD/CapB family tyrosine-protein kinase [Planomicrobium sp. CPCC 101079]TWT04948.1 CpsD/CapB family tyrosine-protein kinase [Planomicrobium sp. CPCC 101079]
MLKSKKNKPLATRKLVARTNPNSIVTEQYRTIRSNINFSLPSADMKTLLFTSASKEEGKSTTSGNIAIVYAESGKKVLLVDADMRRPTLHHTFRMSNKVGLSNLLLNKGSLQDAIKKSGIRGLDLLMSGQIPSNPAELLDSEAMNRLIDELREKYDLIIFDSPPILAVTDAKILANKCDGTVLIVNTGKTEKESVTKARDALATAKAFILGVVLNNYPKNKNSEYYQSYES